MFSTHGSLFAAHASIAVRIAPYSNSRVGLWPAFSQIVLRVIIVLSFSRISMTREKPKSIQSHQGLVVFIFQPGLKSWVCDINKAFFLCKLEAGVKLRICDVAKALSLYI